MLCIEKNMKSYINFIFQILGVWSWTKIDEDNNNDDDNDVFKTALFCFGENRFQL